MINKVLKYDKYIAIFSVLALFLIIGGTFALATSWTTNTYNIALDSACMNINYVKGQDINGTIGIMNESTYINNNSITINSSMVFTSVSIELDEDCYDVNGIAAIELNVTSLDNAFKTGGKAYDMLKYVVVEYNPNTYNNLTMQALAGNSFNILASGSITNTGITDIYSVLLNPGDKKDYLILFYASDEIGSHYYFQGSFAASINARVDQINLAPISDFNYTIDSGNVILTDYIGSSSIINIPPTYIIENISYNTKIADGVFDSTNSIIEVNFLDGVLSSTGDASNLFYNCTNLRPVTALKFVQL